MATRRRVIVHADMDAFYAAVEQRDDPSLVGLPVLVGGSHRGVVLTASYEARPWGVGSGMPMTRARRLCPAAIVVPPRFERYVEVSKQVMDVFGRFTPAVEPISLDEAFLDLTGGDHLFGGAEAAARRLKAAVRSVTGLAVSVGISATKYVAKVASDLGKPDGLLSVPPERAVAFLAPLPVSRLWGAGPKTAARLRALGFETIGDVAAANPDYLARELGSAGPRFRALARAEDPRRVVAHRGAQSVGHQRTLPADVWEREELALHLRRAADAVARRLRKGDLVAGGVRVALKTRSFRLMTRQQTLPAPTDLAGVLAAAADELLDRFEHREPYRLVGIAAFDLRRARPHQLDLFVDDGRQRRLEQALDQVVGRFGRGAVRRAEDLTRPGGLKVAPNRDDLRWDPS